LPRFIAKLQKPYNPRVPELAFFVGKGGVGKTTVSAAFAVRRALKASGARVLLVSTDPAHSLGDLFQKELGGSPAKVLLKGRRQLIAWEINSAELFRRFLQEHKQALLDTIESGSLFTAAEISSLLETTLPGMSEIAALLAIQEAIESRKYSHIVIDTAPFGHTLRLFGLPEQFLCLLNFLELSADRDRVLARHFGGNVRARGTEFIDEWRTKVEELKNAFAEARLFLVTTAERFALNESVRCIQELRRTTTNLKLQATVLNRVILRPGACARCRKRALNAAGARARLQKLFSSADLRVGEDPGCPIVGISGLEKFGSHVFDRRPLQFRPAAPKSSRKAALQFIPASWPTLAAPLSFVVGKGGVGKTTVSAGLGYHTRARSENTVEICSVDPAPSLDDIFKTPVGDQPVPVLGDPMFRASELDSLALFKRWVGKIRAEVDSATTAEYSGVHIDLSYERRLFSELLEIVPPGLDEILAIFRIIELLGGASRKIVIDMAPTGHALELLRMPERILVWARLLLKSLAAHRKLALAREAAVKIADLEVRARELAAALKSSRRAEIFSVMLPEPLPDRETERLLQQLKALGLAANTIFVNRVSINDSVGKCSRCSLAAQWQAAAFAGLKQRFRGKTLYAIPNFDNELSGKSGLRKLTTQLWLLK
jgi:arsenite-transporting ATPase